MPYTPVQPRPRWRRRLDRFWYGVNPGCLAYTLVVPLALLLVLGAVAFTGYVVLAVLHLFSVAWAPAITVWHSFLVGLGVSIVSSIFGGARVVRVNQ